MINKSLVDISPQKRVVVTVGISYGDNVKKAKSLLESYLKDLDGVDKDSIAVYLDSLGDYSVNITGKAMVDANKWSYLMEKEILERVYEEFPKNGLNFPFPTYSLIIEKNENA
jgi:small-conductance mechanosensitive channel